MKKIVLVALVVMSFVVFRSEINAASSNTESFVITGKLVGLGNDTIFLGHRTSEGTIYDTAVAKNDSFSFSGKCPEPRVYTLKWKHKGNKLGTELFIENAAITVMGNADNDNMLTIAGSVSQKKYDELHRLILPLNGQIDSLGNMMGSLNPEKNEREIKMLDSVYNILNNKRKELAAGFIAHNLKSPVSAFVALRILVDESPALGKLDTVFQSIDAAVQNSYYGKQLGSVITSLKKTTIGQPAANFTMKDTGGNPVSLDSYKGKVVLIDFWASWCGPCRQENPNVVAAYRKYHSRGLEILGVSLDEKRNNWIAAIIKDTLSWQHVSELNGWNNSAAGLYGIRFIPNNYLIGKDGKILAKTLYGEGLTKKLEEVLK